MLNKIKLFFIGFGLLSLIGLSSYLGYKSYELIKITRLLNEKLQEANLEIGKAQTEITKKDISMKDLSNELQKVLKNNKELVVKYNEIVALYNASGHGNSNNSTTSDTIHSNDNLFDIGHIYLAISKNDILNFNPPVKFKFQDYHLNSDISLLSNQDQLFLDVSYQLNLRLSIKQIETISKTGARNNYIELYELDNNDKEINKLKLTKFISVIKDDRTKQFHFWNLKLDFSAATWFDTQFNYGASLGITPFSYGLTTNDLAYKFARFGFLFSSQKFSLNFSPIEWNAASHLPILSNLWLYPFISYSFPSIGGGIGLGVQL
jgi:hypothetical protein